MHRAFDEADADRNVRAIILTGSGAAFSAGYDQAAVSASGVRARRSAGQERTPNISSTGSAMDGGRISLLDAHVGARQTGDRGSQRLGHGRRVLVSARLRHHDCLGPGGVRAAGGAAHLQHHLPVHRAVRLEGGQPLGAHRRPFRRPGSAAHRHGQRGGAARRTDAARAGAGASASRWCRSPRSGSTRLSRCWAFRLQA